MVSGCHWTENLKRLPENKFEDYHVGQLGPEGESWENRAILGQDILQDVFGS